ncbi:MAG: enoyl-CoA hydratase-related protein [Candidatus Kapaibacterium sp.]
MEYKFIKNGVEDSVAFIILNRPEKLNSINKEMALEIQHALDSAASDTGIRAVYLSGEGRAFCAGQDLSEVIGKDEMPLSDIVRESYNPIIKKIRYIEKPVVCGVNGVAAGAGANLALACDIVFASDTANFIQSFSGIGLIPDSGGTFFLPRKIGLARATAMMFTGEKVSANKAKKWGLIYRSVEPAILEKEALGMAKKLAKMPTKGLAYTKMLLNMSFRNSLEDQLDMEMEYQAKAGSTADYKEGVDAFLEKRIPEFKGK